MSRIHEALKKAAQERSLRRGDAAPVDPFDLAAQVAAEEALTRPEVEDSKQLRAAVEDASVSGYDQFLSKCTRGDWVVNSKHSVFADEASDRMGAERFRTLRSRLAQIAADHPLKRILVTSSVPEEGKTFITGNLAQSILRQPGNKVLLIDADLRASRMNYVMGSPSSPGLGDYLAGKAEEFKFVHVGREPNLCFIPGGTHISNPSEMLHSDRMIHLLDRLTPIFDWVILDSPPAMAVHDASILADMCDGVLFPSRTRSLPCKGVSRPARSWSSSSKNSRVTIRRRWKSTTIY